MKALLVAVTLMVSLAAPGAARVHAEVGASTARIDANPSRSGLDVVVTTKGTVRGVATPATRSFLGVPYAAAPIGDLRWRPPRSHAPWAQVLDATHFGNHCPQHRIPLA